jgi:hypothetical protein
MIAEQPSLAAAALHWLPEPSTPTRELQPPVDALPTVLEWLADEGFHGGTYSPARPAAPPQGRLTAG